MRIPVPLRSAYKLLNHGPTTLITTAFGGRRNVMAAAWVMPLDFEPPKVAAVIAGDTFTRELLLGAETFVVQTPTAAMAGLTYAVGSESGREGDKFTKHGIPTSAASQVAAPFVEGCAAWLECRRIAEPDLEARYDLFVGEVVAAWADDLSWDGRAFAFRSDAARTIHHLAKGHFYVTGERLGAAD